MNVKGRFTLWCLLEKLLLLMLWHRHNLCKLVEGHVWYKLGRNVIDFEDEAKHSMKPTRYRFVGDKGLTTIGWRPGLEDGDGIEF